MGNRHPQASQPGEILASEEFYTYDDKYIKGTSRTRIPADLDPAVLERVRTTAVKAYRALGCEGLSRVDFFVETSTGRVLLNEINTLPGFTAISMYPKMMAAQRPVSARSCWTGWWSWHWKGRESAMDKRPIGVFDSGAWRAHRRAGAAQGYCPRRTSSISATPAGCPTAAAAGRSSSSMPGRISPFSFLKM